MVPRQVTLTYPCADWHLSMPFNRPASVQSAAIARAGESNSVTGQNETYSCRFKAMLDDWRTRWHHGTANTTDPLFPVGFVQFGGQHHHKLALSLSRSPLSLVLPTSLSLSPFHRVCLRACSTGPTCGPDARIFATRIGQTGDAGVLASRPLWPNTFMATAIDLPNTPSSGSPAGGVHLMDKPTIAHRLALGARATVYREADLVHTGPQLLSVTRLGSTMRFLLTFADDPVHSSGGGSELELRGTASGVAGFEIYDNLAWATYRGPTIGVWVPARVVANTSSSLTVEAFSLLPQTTQIRYAHRDTPCPPHECLVYNRAGLPLAPFQTTIADSGGEHDGGELSPFSPVKELPIK